MFLSVTYLDNEPDPFVYSIPPNKDRDREASITVEPFGPDKSGMFDDDFDLSAAPKPEKGSTTINLSIAEAEELARRLFVVVQAAKQGIYSTMGEELVKFSREKGLKDAWDALMSDDSDY